jgi:hypothetical protein
MVSPTSEARAPSIAEQRDGPKPKPTAATITGTTNTSERFGIFTSLSTAIATIVAIAVIIDETR